MNKDRTCGADDAELTQARSPDVHGWQPISTAPKDGSPVDLWFEDGRVPDAFFEDGKWMWWTGWKANRNGRGGSHRYASVSNMFPTHWQPLPSPPAQS